jgi:hypothetical protein
MACPGAGGLASAPRFLIVLMVSSVESCAKHRRYGAFRNQGVRDATTPVSPSNTRRIGGGCRHRLRLGSRRALKPVASSRTDRRGSARRQGRSAGDESPIDQRSGAAGTRGHRGSGGTTRAKLLPPGAWADAAADPVRHGDTVSRFRHRVPLPCRRLANCGTLRQHRGSLRQNRGSLPQNPRRCVPYLSGGGSGSMGSQG